MLARNDRIAISVILSEESMTESAKYQRKFYPVIPNERGTIESVKSQPPPK